MARLPDEFLEWNYYGRRRLLERLLSGGAGRDMALEFTRHTPVLVTAAEVDGRIEVNGKVVGCGYVASRDYIREKIRVFREHVEESDERLSEGASMEEVEREHLERGVRLLLEHVYLERERAEKEMDFEVLATVELAKRVPWSSRHTWTLIQRNPRVSLVFFQPPSLSFEVKGYASIHLDDEYHEYVTLVHDAFHYTPPERRGDRPVYLVHVEEVYDNSASPRGFGRRIA
ncbi:hypothetical protein [Thermofilum pendens]|uniref:Uncharacterized protein n=1 Tax=Thermofilum pendens (strain DSM 2475 / Hrk 5) TaxID=368408 RepID=A1S086_THEPD|nr:hypothetical protein [Thermofilum pendens]ABL78866.1 conserved hypothetical protein [Thermofilum pendens Hrk 5]